MMSSCTNENAGDEGLKNTSKNISIRVSVDSSELILETRIDSNKINNTVSIKQMLIFKQNGHQIAQSPSPIIANNKVFTHEDSITVLDNVIYEIGALKGGKGNLFTIYGAGSCNACPELVAFYNQSGKCVWLNYSNASKVYKSIGDFTKELNTYGIDSTKWFNKDYRRVTVDL